MLFSSLSGVIIKPSQENKTTYLQISFDWVWLKSPQKQQTLQGYSCFLPKCRLICQYACIIVIADHRGRVCWHDSSFQLDTKHITNPVIFNVAGNVGIWLKCTWVIKRGVSQSSISVSDGCLQCPVLPFKSACAWPHLCCSLCLWLCVSPVTELLFALNLPVFTMNLCLCICWNVWDIYFLSVLAIWNKFNSMDNMFEIVKAAIINNHLTTCTWKGSLILMDPQIITTRTCCSLQFYCSFKVFFSSLFGFSGSTLLFWFTHMALFSV